MLTKSRFMVALFLASLFLVPLCPAQTRRPALFRTITIRVKEGTNLGFDLSNDGRAIVFDLLGQLWLVPGSGGPARMLTDAVRDQAEDLDPSFSPDGGRVLFRGERNGRTGLWLLSLEAGRPRQLTQLSDPDSFEGQASWSPDGRFILFVRRMPRDATRPRGYFAIMSLDVASGTARELSITGMPNPFVSDPVWLPGSQEIAFVNRMPLGGKGGRIWMVAASGGQARPITDESVRAIGPVFSADGQRLAYFAPDSAGRMQVWAQTIAPVNGDVRPPIRITNHTDVTPTRIRWSPDGNELLYSADGRLWKVNASGGEPKEISFTAELSIRQSRPTLPQARLPEPGQQTTARGFMGMAIAPDGRRIGALALGKFWLIPVDGGQPRAVADVPFGASSLAWSPDATEVAWSAGVADNEDLFATNVATGATRRVTALAGGERNPAYSPDGRYLAFVHVKDTGVLRLVDVHAGDVADVAQTKDLGVIGLNGTSAPQWSPESDGLLVSGAPGRLPRATFIPLSGQRQTLTKFPDGPIFLQWTAQHTIIFVRHDRLWEAPFDHNGLKSEPRPMGTDAALYASTSRDGGLLYVSNGGLRLRSPQGAERSLGWPLTYTPPVADATLVRNVRIIDGNGGPATDPRDILIEGGRIKQIAPAGTIRVSSVRVIDAAGRFVIPGLIDLHAHLDRPDLLPGSVYFGITTVRDQGSAMAPMVAYADDIAAGILPGPRVAYGGFQFYSDYAFDGDQWRGIEPEFDPNHIKRAVDLAEAFGAQHIKTRTFRRWDINARMIAEAHRRGMRVTGHCSHLLPLVAAGMDAKEHIGGCETRGDTYMYDDMIQLFRAANIGVVPTLSYVDLAWRLNEKPDLLNQDAELAPFVPAQDAFGWMLELTAEDRKEWREMEQRMREMTIKLSRAGVTLGAGTDIWQIPTGIHIELEQLVAAGLSPTQAIHVGTANSARILGAEKDLGTIEAGKWADLVFLDADPLADIRNTRRIWNVMQYGRLVDRAAVLKVMRPRLEESLTSQKQ